MNFNHLMENRFVKRKCKAHNGPCYFLPVGNVRSTAGVLSAAPDLRIDIVQGDKLIVDRSMIEEISVGGTIYNVILDNYVLGIIK